MAAIKAQYFTVLEEERLQSGEIVYHDTGEYILTLSDAIKKMWAFAQEMIWDLTGNVINDGHTRYVTEEKEEVYCEPSGDQELSVILRDHNGKDHTLSTFSVLSWG